MKKNEVWRDRSGGLWRIVVADDEGPFPIAAKPLDKEMIGLQLYTKDGRYGLDDEVSPLDLVAKQDVLFAKSRAERDDIFLAACHAMSTGMSAADAVGAAVKLVQEFHARVRV